MSKDITFKKNQIVENRHGHFAKIIELKNGFVHFAGWFPKKKRAEEAEGATSFLNKFGMARAMGKLEALTDTAESLTGNDGEGDSNDGDENVDPFDGVTVSQLKEALKDAELPVGGKRDELVARCKKNNIEFKVETE